MKFIAILLIMVAAVSGAQRLSKLLAELSLDNIKGFDVVSSIKLQKVANPGLEFIEMTLVQNNLNDQRIYTVGQRKKGEQSFLISRRFSKLYSLCAVQVMRLFPLVTVLIPTTLK